MERFSASAVARLHLHEIRPSKELQSPFSWAKTTASVKGRGRVVCCGFALANKMKSNVCASKSAGFNRVICALIANVKKNDENYYSRWLLKRRNVDAFSLPPYAKR